MTNGQPSRNLETPPSEGGGRGHPHKQYRFEDLQVDASRGVTQVTNWLVSRGYAVENVEGDRHYQQLDVDLLATRNGRTCQVEVKFDRYRTPNLAFETVSNTSKWTTGCFMRTAADVLAYVRVTDEALGGAPGLTLMPMAAVRPWFVLNEQSFRLYRTSTPVGVSGIYETVGRLVPLRRLLDAGLGVRHLRLP